MSKTSIRLPADVEISTALINQPEAALTGDSAITIECVPNGKFNKIIKISVSLPQLGTVLVITPKERK